MNTATLRWAALSASAITLGIGLFGGYYIGRLSAAEERKESWQLSQSVALLEQTQVAAVMRSGDPNLALKLLESHIDMSLLTIDHYERQAPPFFDKQALSALKFASIYRSKYQKEYQEAQKSAPGSFVYALKNTDQEAVVQDRIRRILSRGDQQGELMQTKFVDKYLNPSISH